MLMINLNQKINLKCLIGVSTLNMIIQNLMFIILGLNI